MKNNPIIVLFNYVSVFKLVCLLDIHDAVKNNTIIVLFKYEGIAIIETMAPTLESETVKC